MIPSFYHTMGKIDKFVNFLLAPFHRIVIRVTSTQISIICYGWQFLVDKTPPLLCKIMSRSSPVKAYEWTYSKPESNNLKVHMDALSSTVSFTRSKYLCTPTDKKEKIKAEAMGVGKRVRWDEGNKTREETTTHYFSYTKKSLSKPRSRGVWLD